LLFAISPKKSPQPYLLALQPGNPPSRGWRGRRAPLPVSRRPPLISLSPSAEEPTDGLAAVPRRLGSPSLDEVERERRLPNNLPAAPAACRSWNSTSRPATGCRPAPMMWVPSILPLPGCVHPLPPRLSRPRGAELENERSGCGEASKERARRDIGQGYSFVLLGKLQTGKWNMYRLQICTITSVFDQQICCYARYWNDT
uniref:Uncharacterized protein n=1 Tax=Triticum urartu TaxID=4572 RepID=A0A8R7VAV0_TRIUA